MSIARACPNAIDHNSLFLMPVWRAIGKSRWVVEARTLPENGHDHGDRAGAAVGELIIPSNFDMKAKGTLQPVKKMEMFAPEPGEVADIRIDNGSQVQAGDVLLMLNRRSGNQEAGNRRPVQRGQRKPVCGGAAAHQPAAQHDAGRADRLEAEEAKLRPQVKFYGEQLTLINEQVEKLAVKSPISGKVMTWDAKKNLQNRPVETGQVLMTIAAADTDYEVELYMPERRMGHLHRARDRVKTRNPADDLVVSFVSMNDPGISHNGHVLHVNPTAEPHEEHGNMVRIRVQPDEELKNPRPGRR